jgi:hypothetical protein
MQSAGWAAADGSGHRRRRLAAPSRTGAAAGGDGAGWVGVRCAGVAASFAAIVACHRPSSRSRFRARPLRQAGACDRRYRGLATRYRVAGRTPQHRLSGLATEAAPGWTTADLRQAVDHVVRLFGPQRLLWGSDWPVVNLAGGYEKWFAATETLLANLSPDDKAAVFGGNAARIYLSGRGRRPG